MPLAYSAYVDLSGTVFLLSDMNFEGFEGEDSSTCKKEFKVFAPVVSSNSLPPGISVGRMSRLFLSPLTSHTQNRPVLRCQANLPSFFFILSQVGRYRYPWSTKPNGQANEGD